MLNDSLVAFNIYNKETGKLYNKTGYTPILYYWNGEGDVVEEILTNDNFIQKYLKDIDNENDLNNINIALFYFKYIDDYQEDYIETNIEVNDHIDLSSFDSTTLIIDILYNRLIHLYQMSINQKVENDISIKDIYLKIKEKYQEAITKETIINWVRSELIKDNYNVKNINTIINTLQTEI